MQEVLKMERNRAAAGRKQEVAVKPASYKSSLSLALPVGTTRQKERHEINSPQRRHVPAEGKHTSKRSSNVAQNSEEALKRAENLKAMYGDASAQGKINN